MDIFAVITSGGKQYKVAPGDRLDVELLGVEQDAQVNFKPIMVGYNDKVLTTSEELEDIAVLVKVLGESKGPKVRGFTYKSKTNSSRRWGHRQHYNTIEVLSVEGIKG
ncbi:MAG: 50S ribosomal protein L21 [Actinobacteria bacterium]|nr:50S ribosomal protein L21 [Actinomycetota bacterium]MCL6105361.1 50S ribosomal protein L21 [Actinomycetota bacterium]